MHTTSFSLLPCIFLVLFFCGFICSDSGTLTNNCPVMIWLGTLAGSGMPQLPMTGFVLELSRVIGSLRYWVGHGGYGRGQGARLTRQVWVHALLETGGRLKCAGNGATPPTSLFEITLGKGTDKGFYDVSIIDGYNLPLVVAPQSLYDEWNATSCTSDINLGCPNELQVVEGNGEDGNKGVIACRSACEAFGFNQDCCSGEFANPTSCRQSYYSAIFKRGCPRAYSYAVDDRISTFTCKAYGYRIIFCPDTEG